MVKLARSKPKPKPGSGIVTGRIRQPVSTSAPIIYIDGSVSHQRLANGKGWMTGWGYLGTDGRYGCGAYPQWDGVGGTSKSITITTDLRAIWHAVGDSLAHAPVIVVTDGEDTEDMVNRWKAGSTAMPTGYQGAARKTPTLERLRRAIAANPGNITIRHTRGHAGDVLNEGADTLAQLGMRWVRDSLTEEDVVRRAEGVAEGFLADYRARR